MCLQSVACFHVFLSFLDSLENLEITALASHKFVIFVGSSLLGFDGSLIEALEYFAVRMGRASGFDGFRRANWEETISFFIYLYYLLVATTNSLNAFDVPENDVILNVLRNLLSQILHIDKSSVIGAVH